MGHWNLGGLLMVAIIGFIAGWVLNNKSRWWQWPTSSTFLKDKLHWLYS